MKGGFVMPFGKDSLVKEHIGQDDISGFLAEGTGIKGEIRFRDMLRVDGKISGKVQSEGELVVGESGEIEAEVQVGTLSVSGKVSGTMKVRDKVEIHAKGRISGELTVEKPNLVIHEGAVFEGDVNMNAARKDPNQKGAAPKTPNIAGIEPIRRSETA
jgi:cytoskeletal protein CcmA (bactofilin family)